MGETTEYQLQPGDAVWLVRWEPGHAPIVRRALLMEPVRPDELTRMVLVTQAGHLEIVEACAADDVLASICVQTWARTLAELHTELREQALAAGTWPEGY